MNASQENKVKSRDRKERRNWNNWKGKTEKKGEMGITDRSKVRSERRKKQNWRTKENKESKSAEEKKEKKVKELIKGRNNDDVVKAEDRKLAKPRPKEK